MRLWDKINYIEIVSLKNSRVAYVDVKCGWFSRLFGKKSKVVVYEQGVLNFWECADTKFRNKNVLLDFMIMDYLYYKYNIYI